MLRIIERGLFFVGVMCLGLFVAGYGASRVQAIQAIDAFDLEKDQASVQAKTMTILEPDTSSWSPERIESYRSASNRKDAAIGVLKVDSAGIAAPIFAGASDRNLDRGIGWIEGTAQLGQDGNVGLAGHRDGFFRALKDIRVGDRIRTSTLTGERVYQVTATDIVSPQDVYVLENTNSPTLTLVTCHPFYFVGSAPNRFVVYAIAADHEDGQ